LLPWRIFALYNLTMKNDFPQRFLDKVKRGKARSDCDLWTGAQTSGGYGLFRVGGESVYAHRYVWEQAHGPIPKGINVKHKAGCGNPACVKLAHLELDARDVRETTADGRRYQRALDTLGLSFADAAVFLDLTKRTARDYAANGPPRSIATLLALMIKQRLSVDDVNRIVGRP
jgi:HNH endonuclease